MKRYIVVIVLFCAVAESISGQFTVTSSSEYIQITDQQDINAIFLFNGISASTEISYNGTENFEWRKYDNSFVANTPNFSPDDATGYIVFDKINNKPLYHIWVIDYSLYRIGFDGVTTNGDCYKLSLNTNFNVPNLVYYDKNNKQKSLKRTFYVHYVDYTYKDSTWQDIEMNSEHTYPFTDIEINAPKKDVNICISGDNFARAMHLSGDTSICIDYKAIAVECHLSATVEKRSGTNEYLRDNSENNTVKGSGPLIVSLENKSNNPVATFFEWKIYKNSAPQSYNRYNEENIRYSFNETGDYTAVLKVSNADGICTSTDSVRVTVLESLLEVPNAFSPNGDGINDEFRVVFKSLKTYNIVIFNRWGRVVYKSNDPSKGWDGKIGRNVAASGTYYYVIEATGTDRYTEGRYKDRNIIYNIKGHINLFK